ncbi:dihydrofolate reductase family protein [Actinoplanes derwentensis]|uniref:Dihydrofolate reductase n=1 Tax=Actinoplanes derwentensis TaxID=113562 RepID=A0A1H2AJ84_9ACTN|nr:dihydrofolate reductase family protein [Actinoplanes derwentensis]GID88772.1 dihydrofolate reductase [Actinoplanes derwentensis]SDT46033.1 Dihydrofolate reductase [Actinoplanes derwentensis]
MGLIHIDLFSTLDLVAQAPGRPGEDPEGGFTFGGWQAPLMDEAVGRSVMEGMQGLDALLLGRKTYDIWAAYWPHQNDSIGKLFNSVPKYVASRGNPELNWAGSTLLKDVREVRDSHENVHVIGSLDFAQTLLRERLFDRLTLWLYPIMLGAGKKVFDGGAVPSNLRLLEPPVAGSTGAVILKYALADGVPGTGDMTEQ